MLLAWPGPNTPQVSVDLPPPPHPLGPILPIFGGLAILLVVAVLLRRLLRGRRGAAGMFSFSVGVGNALNELAAMVQADRPQVTVASEKEPGQRRRGSAVGDAKPPPDRSPHRPSPPP